MKFNQDVLENQQQLYYKKLKKAKRRGYQRAMCAWGIPDEYRLIYATRIRDCDDIDTIAQIVKEIEAHADAMGAINLIEGTLEGYY